MGPQSERDELRAAWRALSGDTTIEGWRTIAVVTGCACRVLAGRRFPANDEAVLFGFRAAARPRGELPQGRGFEVCIADLKSEHDNRIWIALCRQSEGNLDLFETMAEDVIATLARLCGTDEATLLTGFLERVRAWQEFMRRGPDGLLSLEAELGLVGELEMLRALVALGVPEHQAVYAWKGPLQAVHDFSLMGGAIEVKSTISHASFPARIASLEQLDIARVHPLFLAGLRFKIDPRGVSLPDLAQSIGDQLAKTPSLEQVFKNLVLRAGLWSAFAASYSRRFLLAETRIIEVSDTFPRLTRANVAAEVLTASYELDLDLIRVPNFGLAAAIDRIGVA